MNLLGKLFLCLLLPGIGFAQPSIPSGNPLEIPASVDVVPHSRDFIVKVRSSGGDWCTVPVCLTQVAHRVGIRTLSEETSIASFDFSKSVDVRITANKEALEKLRVRPLSYGIKPDIKGNTLSFSLSQPRNLSIEIDGDIFHNLQLFANSPEPFTPLKD